MKPKLGLITLGVKDLARSRAFYVDGLGFPTHGDYEGVVFCKLEGTWLALFPRAELAKDATTPLSSEGIPPFSLAHNVVSKEEVNQVMALAEKAGATVVKEAADTFWGGYSGYFKDPDGFLFEVAWNPFIDLT